MKKFNCRKFVQDMEIIINSMINTLKKGRLAQVASSSIFSKFHNYKSHKHLLKKKSCAVRKVLTHRLERGTG